MKNTLSATESSTLLNILKARFDKNMKRHQGISWAEVQARLESKPDKLWTLQQMEETGGEPDVVGQDPTTGEFLFYDCAAESPKGRRSFCYDQQALDERKEFKPADSAVEAARAMGIELLNETRYRELQQFGPFDTKTSSWIHTPDAIRKHGGAIFADYRYAHVFVYHNGASSYYAARGFRGWVGV
ncbi:MAG: DUF4256 domain-containing protein [Saprospiraceae bacterium]|nr:DUF4256 domain-containing protein [Saprospiraceae bacterium]